jgi:hypothetical protein
LSNKPAYPDNKKHVVEEINHTIDKLTHEYGIGPAYSCIHGGAYCIAQIILLYENTGKKVPKELNKFINETYPKLLEENELLMEEQHTMLNTSGSA